MNFVVNSTAFVRELRLLNQIVESKPTLPILANMLVGASNDNVSLYATDMELGLTTGCRAQVKESGITTLPVKRLLSLVEQFPDADVTVATEGPHVRITSGAFNSRLQTLAAEDYPNPVLNTGEVTTLATTAFQSMIKRVKYAISDKGQHAVRGAQLTIADAAIGLVSTDGKRLSLTTLARSVNGTGAVAVIPQKALDAISSVFVDGTEILFSQSERHLFFASGNRLLTSSMLATAFPAYQRIIPKTNEHKATVTRTALAAALRRVMCVSEETQQVYLHFAPGVLEITSRAASVGDAVEAVPMTYEGPTITAVTSGQFLLDFLEVAVSHDITIDLKDDRTPLLLTDGADFINVVMLARAEK